MLDSKYNQSVSAYGFYRKDLEAKNIKGSDYDEVVRLDERINQIAAECDSEDIMGFTQKITSEGIATKLNEAYMRAINSNSKSGVGGRSNITGGIHTSKTGSILGGSSSGNIVSDIKRMKEDPSKENAIQLAKETGRQTFRLARFINSIRRRFGF